MVLPIELSARASVEGLDEVGGGEVPDPVPSSHGGVAERDEHVALPRPCRADQADVLGGADPFQRCQVVEHAGYLIMWGSNLPVTRTPDAHWMVEARYRGQKVVAVAPDYADNVKFADEWLPAKPGTDARDDTQLGSHRPRRGWDRVS